MLFTEIITDYPENHTKPTNTICGQNAELLTGDICALEGFTVQGIFPSITPKQLLGIPDMSHNKYFIHFKKWQIFHRKQSPVWSFEAYRSKATNAS